MVTIVCNVNYKGFRKMIKKVVKSLVFLNKTIFPIYLSSILYLSLIHLFFNFHLVSFKSFNQSSLNI